MLTEVLAPGEMPVDHVPARPGLLDEAEFHVRFLEFPDELIQGLERAANLAVVLDRRVLVRAVATTQQFSFWPSVAPGTG